MTRTFIVLLASFFLACIWYAEFQYVYRTNAAPPIRQCAPHFLGPPIRQGQVPVCIRYNRPIPPTTVNP